MTRACTLVVSGLLLAACTHTPSQAPADRVVSEPGVLAQDDAMRYWWYARFEMQWPTNTRPDFSKNLAVAHEVVAPLVDRHADRIPLWRFHRRARRDRDGHQFAFIFYATREQARAVFAEIQAHPTVAELTASDDQDLFHGCN